MKRIYHTNKASLLLMGIILTAQLFASCTVESSSNGKLDGFWHLEAVDTLATGGTADYSEQRQFWGIEHKLISVRDIDGGSSYYFRFEQKGDSLFLGQAYKNNGHQDNGENGGDIPVTSPEDLQRFGITQLNEHFYKEVNNGSHLSLRSKTFRLRFVKF